MIIAITNINGEWYYHEDSRNAFSTRGYRSIAEAMRAAAAEHSKAGRQVTAFAGHCDRQCARELGIPIREAAHRQGRKRQGPQSVAAFNDKLHFLFGLAKKGKIEWPEFKERLHRLLKYVADGEDIPPHIDS